MTTPFRDVATVLSETSKILAPAITIINPRQEVFGFAEAVEGAEDDGEDFVALGGFPQCDEALAGQVGVAGLEAFKV